MGGDRKAGETLVPKGGLSAVEALWRLSQQPAYMDDSISIFNILLR